MHLNDNMNLFKRKVRKLFDFSAYKNNPQEFGILKDAHDTLLEFHRLKLAKKVSSPRYRQYQMEHSWIQFLKLMEEYLQSLSDRLGESFLDKVQPTLFAC